MVNDLRIRKWSNFVPRQLINAEIRLKNLQLGRALTARARHERDASAALPPGAAISVDVSPYPLLGHQVSSWIAGFLWAKELGLPFRGGSIPADGSGLFNLDAFHESGPANERVLRAVPTEDERDPRSAPALRDQIRRRLRRRPGPTQFKLCRDPQRWDQIPASEAVRKSILDGYLGTHLRELEAGPDYIALHVRRGEDINKTTTGGDGMIRWVEQDYYVHVLKQIQSVPQWAGLPVWVLTVDKLDGFEELLSMPNVTVRADGDRDRDLVFLAAATVLVTSPSSFSFTAALASHGTRLVRFPWWHHVPDTDGWVHVDQTGKTDERRLSDIASQA